MNNDAVPVLLPGPEQGTLRARDTKIDHIDSLLRTLDSLIFLQLGILYLCDNLTFFLFLRAFSQVLHVRQSEALQFPPVIFANLLCFGTHLLQQRPETKYLHGGLIVDFVGDLAPSRWRVLLLDLIVFGLQLLMLVVGHEKTVVSGNTQVQEESQPQDIESEEAGRLRSQPQDPPSETADGIELQSLLPDRASEDRPAHAALKLDTQGDDLIVLDMKKGLKALLRRPPQPTSPAMDSPAARAGFANMLARIAAARVRAGTA
ncbi:hypothetical protein A1O3_04030 [Capronia epimyces CBS 606.96]|uniref:DUF1746 domain-containing protein n=1 Tax=Capronia epimyces CBS 606.96 TaxID=1182542 RepID=W9Y2N7_9EURO|nr:uncharacterized protein A1O3_04030 [Capronia epimyces CBS 606.96]EXJ87072.1 hypothetical protein A1O3_04030 [Capronia epimyces CBS 606.96]